MRKWPLIFGLVLLLFLSGVASASELAPQWKTVSVSNSVGGSTTVQVLHGPTYAIGRVSCSANWPYAIFHLEVDILNKVTYDYQFDGVWPPDSSYNYLDSPSVSSSSGQLSDSYGRCDFIRRDTNASDYETDYDAVSH